MTTAAKSLTCHEQALIEHLLEESILTRQDIEYALKIRDRMYDRQSLEETLLGLEMVEVGRLDEAIRSMYSDLGLGRIMVLQGAVTADQLAAVEAANPDCPDPEERLVEAGLTGRESVLAARAAKAGLDYLEPNHSMLERDLLKIAPVTWLLSCEILPVRRREGAIQVACAREPSNSLVREMERRLGGPVTPALAPLHLIREILIDFEKIEVQLGGAGETNLQERVVEAVDHIVNEAVRMGASDIHLEPMENSLRLRYRLDGVLVHRTDIPRELAPRITARIKIMAELDIAEHRRHQDGRFTFPSGDHTIDMRVSTYVTVHGENIVLRILNKKMGLLDLDDLGMPPNVLREYRDFVLGAPAGVVVITGPTGSGKTTTLYSSIAHCNNMGVKIITAEDPVEYQIDGIMQCSINERIGLTFNDTLRSIVRQDPDIIVLGEIRDRTSAETAIQAALTGHKVFTTFHTEDSVGGLLRLMNMEIETFLISSTVICMVAQRLVRKLCPMCRQEAAPSNRALRRLRLEKGYFEGYRTWRAKGCDHCHYTGYLGRAAIYELLVLGNEVKDALLERRTSHYIRELSIRDSGLVTLQEAGIALVTQGTTTLGEVLHKAPASFRPRPIGEILGIIGVDERESDKQ